LLRNRFLVDAKGLNKVKGQPFAIHEIIEGVHDLLDGKAGPYEVPMHDAAQPETFVSAG
jgi:hypothetical protein